MMNKQEVFNLVYEKLMQQGCQSLTESGMCAYRGEFGAKCAIGHLVDDETAEAWDGKVHVEGGSTEIKSVLIPPKYEWMHGMLDFLGDLQIAHDSATCDFRSEFQFGMIKVAQRYKLEKPWEVSA